MIGNSADAALAVAEYRQYSPDYLLTDMGSTRMVYLINGIVYKVDIYDQSENESEYETITNMREHLPEGIHYPQVSLFHVLGGSVIAMEYITGQQIAQCYCMSNEPCGPDCMTDDEYNMLFDVLPDSCGYNVVRRGDGYWIIDAV